jgi:hypothetical protein
LMCAVVNLGSGHALPKQSFSFSSDDAVKSSVMSAISLNASLGEN